MKKKIFFICILIVLLLWLFADVEKSLIVNGLSKNHHLLIFPIKSNYVRHYVFIDDSNVLMHIGGFEMLNMNIVTKKSTLINIDTGGLKVNTMTGMYYDDSENIVVLNIVQNESKNNPSESRLFLFDIENHNMKEVIELRNKVTEFWYNSNENKIYFYSHEEYYIDIFDLNTNQFCGKIIFPENINSKIIYNMYGTKVLTECPGDKGGHFYLWDFDLQEGIFFKEINIENINRSTFLDYIPVDDAHFLCINCRGPEEYEIVELDLLKGKVNAISAQIYNKEIYYLRRLNGDRYSFLMPINHKYTLLCFFDYSPEGRL
jgi:hypothetical protein